MSKLVKCKACGNEIAKGSKCPRCGKDQRNFFSKRKILAVIVVIAIVGAILQSTVHLTPTLGIADPNTDPIPDTTTVVSTVDAARISINQ